MNSSPAPADDDGSVPGDLADVLTAHATGAAGLRDLVTALSRHRVLVPLLEVTADQLPDGSGDPCAGAEKAVAAVSVRQPDGTPLGLAFTGVAALQGWNPRARPLPVSAPRAAAAVLADDGRALLVDAGSHHPVRIEGVALRRLATAEVWPDPWDDPAVQAAVGGELAPILATGEVQVRLAAPRIEAAGGSGGPARAAAPKRPPRGGPESPTAPALTLQVRFRPDVDAHLVDERLQTIARRVSNSPALREVFDGVLAVHGGIG